MKLKEIENRIVTEYQKHKNIDWQKILAKKLHVVFSETIESLQKRVKEKDYQFKQIKKIIKDNTNVNGLMDADAIGFDLCRHFSYDEEDIVYGSIPVRQENTDLKAKLKEVEDMFKEYEYDLISKNDFVVGFRRWRSRTNQD